MIPKIEHIDTDLIDFRVETRACLIIDSGRGFLIEENSNYSGLKITTKASKYKHVNRVKIKNWKSIGLKKESYLRIELPLKIEKEQLVRKIGKVSEEDFSNYMNKLVNYFNLDVLEKYNN